MTSIDTKENQTRNGRASLEKEKDADSKNKLLGLTLVDQGKIKPSDINAVLKYSKKHELRFGEAAVKLKLLSREQLDEALATQFNYSYININNKLSAELVAARSPFSRKGESLRTLRSQLILRWFSQGRKSLAVVAPHEGCGSSYIAANLAVIWSQIGERTLLVDADLRHGRQCQIFGLKNQKGLSGALVGSGPIESMIQRVVPFKKLFLLPSGAPPPNPEELLERKEFGAIMSSIRDQYDVIIFDLPSMNSGGGVEFVLSQCSDALLVLRKDKTLLSAAAESIKTIKSVNADVVGSVLTDF